MAPFNHFRTFVSCYELLGKLKKWDTVDEVHRTTGLVIPEAPKVGGASGKIQVDKNGIPLPPPPPPAHLSKLLHVETAATLNGGEAGGSPVSSFYSPGNVIKVLSHILLQGQ